MPPLMPPSDSNDKHTIQPPSSTIDSENKNQQIDESMDESLSEKLHSNSTIENLHR